MCFMWHNYYIHALISVNNHELIRYVASLSEVTARQAEHPSQSEG